MTEGAFPINVMYAVSVVAEVFSNSLRNGQPR